MTRSASTSTRSCAPRRRSKRPPRCRASEGGTPQPTLRRSPQIAFGGLVSLVAEQTEELERAAQGSEESRYSQKSMEALRANLDGTESISGLFGDWLLSKSGGADVNQKVIDGIHALQTRYATVDGQAIPQPPVTWNAASSSPRDLATPFGQLYQSVSAEVDPARSGSVTWEMLREADLLGIPTRR